MSRLLEIGNVEGQYGIGVLIASFAVQAEVQRMVAREVKPGVHIPHRGAKCLCQIHHMIPPMRRAGSEIGNDHRPLGSSQGISGFLQRRGFRGHRGRGKYGIVRRHFYIMIQLGLLKARVVDHIDRALAGAHHYRIGAREGPRHTIDGGRLIIPLDEIADRFALNVGRVNPVDKRPALGFRHRTGRAKDEDRCAVEIGVVDTHRCV